MQARVTQQMLMRPCVLLVHLESVAAARCCTCCKVVLGGYDGCRRPAKPVAASTNATFHGN